MSSGAQHSEARPIWLGLAGAYTAFASEPNHYATKVGGPPCFPGTQVPTDSNLVPCGVCGKQLSLVVQAYAPLSKAEHGFSLPERCLYVYGCTQPGCGREARAWRAFRCQLPSPPPQQPAQPPAQAQPPEQASTQPTSTHGSDGGFPGETDMFGLGDDDNEAGLDAFDFSALNSALDSSTQKIQQRPETVKAARMDSKQHQGAAVAREAQEPVDQGVVTCRVPVELIRHLMLPEFYITACEEPQGALRQQDAAHIQELLMKYEQEEASAEAKGQGSSSTARPQAGNGGGTDAAAADWDDGGRGSDADSGSWAPEEYEEDEVRGVEPGYLKFNQRLMREPHQCVRYCWHGQLLWPRKQPPAPGLCRQCGAPRVFELQLMASMISLMMEAADLIQSAQSVSDEASSSSSSGAGSVPYGAGITSSAALTSAANWDMCTLAVFTCSQSCGADRTRAEEGMQGAGIWVEEGVALVNEEECHLSMH